jgi:hypothetical protein
VRHVFWGRGAKAKRCRTRSTPWKLRPIASSSNPRLKLWAKIADPRSVTRLKEAAESRTARVRSAAREALALLSHNANSHGFQSQALGLIGFSKNAAGGEALSHNLVSRGQVNRDGGNPSVSQTPDNRSARFSHSRVLRGLQHVRQVGAVGWIREDGLLQLGGL